MHSTVFTNLFFSVLTLLALHVSEARSIQCGSQMLDTNLAKKALKQVKTLLDTSTDFNDVEKYPHVFMDREGIFQGNTEKLYEFPVLDESKLRPANKNQKFWVDGMLKSEAGPHRVIVNDKGVLKGYITHLGANSNLKADPKTMSFNPCTGQGSIIKDAEAIRDRLNAQRAANRQQQKPNAQQGNKPADPNQRPSTSRSTQQKGRVTKTYGSCYGNKLKRRDASVNCAALLEKMAKEADAASAKEFLSLASAKKETAGMKKLAASVGLDKLPAAEDKLLADLRQRLPQYKALQAESPKVRAGFTALKLLSTVGVVQGGVEIIRTFTNDASEEQRVKAIASFVPILGCAADRLDNPLCYIGDALFLAGMAPAGLVVHLINMFFTPERTKQASLYDYKMQWANFIDERIYTPIYSDARQYPQQEFTNYVQSTLAAQELDVISEAASSIGALDASRAVLESDAPDGAELPDGSGPKRWSEEPQANDEQGGEESLGVGVQKAIGAIRDAAQVQISRRNRHFLFEVATNMTNVVGVTLKDAVGPFTDRFKRDFGEVANFDAKKGELPVPKPLEVAFILGQSKGLENMAPETLSALEYIKEMNPEAPETLDVNAIAVAHAVSVVNGLHQDSPSPGGMANVQQLPTVSRDKNDERRQSLETLLAMKCGRLYEQAKVDKEAEDKKGSGYDMNRVYYTRPVRPFQPAHPDGSILIGMMLGLEPQVVKDVHQKLYASQTAGGV
ncbi:hypothetical protein HIM_08108 [Hirsutella minnesotensis 3608]|uniref:Uncharacterized protein n=1 Tax=Hirsutella minnesotensis 3608 TaxID=1043627 RepID=A0A0F8A3U5_9HYPO|nr:hypothetical protein HIM_08108 [Hirsutella minnesotensis 3608]